MTVTGGVAATLFNGATPPNGFMVQLNSLGELGNGCWVSDNGTANRNSAPPVGFVIGGNINGTVPFLFVTPPGYKPMGPVTVWCAQALYIETRGW
jgi:hypothetical protein